MAVDKVPIDVCQSEFCLLFRFWGVHGLAESSSCLCASAEAAEALADNLVAVIFSRKPGPVRIFSSGQHGDSALCLPASTLFFGGGSGLLFATDTAIYRRGRKR